MAYHVCQAIRCQAKAASARIVVLVVGVHDLVVLLVGLVAAQLVMRAYVASVVGFLDGGSGRGTTVSAWHSLGGALTLNCANCSM